MNPNPNPQYLPPPPPPPPPGMYQPPPPRYKMPLGIKILLAAIAVLITLATIAFARYQPSGHAGAGVHSVVYKVDTGVPGGTGNGSITMQTPTGTSQQDADLPMQTTNDQWVTFTDFQPGDFLYVSVQAGDGTNAVACHILIDGKPVSENSATGDYSIASCSATATW